MNIRKSIIHLPRAYESTVSGVTTESAVGAVSFKSKSVSIPSSSLLLHTSVSSSNSEDSDSTVHVDYDRNKLSILTYLFLALKKLVNSGAISEKSSSWSAGSRSNDSGVQGAESSPLSSQSLRSREVVVVCQLARS